MQHPKTLASYICKGQMFNRTTPHIAQKAFSTHNLQADRIHLRWAKVEHAKTLAAYICSGQISNSSTPHIGQKAFSHLWPLLRGRFHKHLKFCRNVHLIRTHRLVTLSVPLKSDPLLWLSPKDLQGPPSLCPEGLQPPFGTFCHLLDILVASKSFKNGQNAKTFTFYAL